MYRPRGFVRVWSQVRQEVDRNENPRDKRGKVWFDWASARCAWDASWPPSYVPGIISQAFADDPKYCWRLRAAVHRR
ncbi:MAG TPA: hypothetical protein PK003_07200, partial [Bacillota bacterium]|nr:hypothetical protein [Bacillota bacterium]